MSELMRTRGMTWVVSNRNYTLRTTLAHTIFFAAGKATRCPNSVLDQAIAVGIIPCDQADMPGDGLDDILPVEATGSARIRQIRTVIEALMRRNGRNDFTASGLPNLAVVCDALHYKIDITEMGKVWHMMQQEAADERVDPLAAIEEVDIPVRPSDTAEFEQAIDEVVLSIFDNGTEEDFTASGAPLCRTIEKRLGYEITEDERDAAHKRHKKPKARVKAEAK